MSDLQFTPATDLDPEFTVTTATQHNTLAGRSTAGAHPATAVTYDNDASGLTAETVQAALDELAEGGGGGAVSSVNGETGVVVLDAEDVGAVPVTAVGLLAGERNRGVWDNATAYDVGDVVHDHGGGGVFVATAPSTGEQPSLNLGSWTFYPVGSGVGLGPGSSSGDAGVAIGYNAHASRGVAVGLDSSSGLGAVAVGPGVAADGDGEVNLANIFLGRNDLDLEVPVEAKIATGFVDLPETAAVTNPAADHQRIIARTDGIYVRNESGTEVGPLGAGGGGGIPETLIDAAGDLIVGTAADTAGRLSIGASGHVLTSDGTTAAWTAPGGGLMQSIGYTSGAIYTLPGNNGSVNYHLASAAGRWVAHPIWLPAGSYAGLSVLSTVAAVATWRLGIYNGTPDGATTLLHDCGTVNTNATPGSLLASSTFTVPTTGLYWLAVLVDAHTATPTVWSFRGVVSDTPVLPYLGARFSNAAAMRVQFARYASGVTTGAMPANAPTQLPTDQPPAIRAHAS